MSLLLQSQSVSKVVEVIRENIPAHYMDDLELSPKITVNTDPILGDTIAECWHHRLDQNVLNLFRPEEWVGYEQGGRIIYAQIVHEVEQVTAVSILNKVLKLMQQKFLIEIGNDTQIEAHVLELYKFIQNDATASDISYTDIDVHVDRIKAAVMAALALPTEQQIKALKRLYLTYHPDKNVENPNATAEFQHLMEEIEQATKETSIDTTDGKQASSGQSNISRCFTQWNQTASSHKKYKSSAKKSKSFSVPTPCKDLNKAFVWIKQAEYDYTALCVLKTTSWSGSNVSAATCFMCHEVAEKSLKAGMYAKCGLGQESLNKHNLYTLANALAQMGCPNQVNDACFLERFYLDTRFPNRYDPCVVPGDQFDSTTTQQAFEAATRTFEVLQQVVKNA